MQQKASPGNYLYPFKRDWYYTVWIFVAGTPALVPTIISGLLGKGEDHAYIRSALAGFSCLWMIVMLGVAIALAFRKKKHVTLGIIATIIINSVVLLISL